jgi:hypothetical protein
MELGCELDAIIVRWRPPGSRIRCPLTKALSQAVDPGRATGRDPGGQILALTRLDDQTNRGEPAFEVDLPPPTAVLLVQRVLNTHEQWDYAVVDDSEDEIPAGPA